MTSRKCEQCKHFIIAKAGEGKIYGCDRSKCVFEPTTKNDLGVEHHKQNIQAYAHDFGVSEEQAEKELRVTTKNDLADDCISRADAIQAMQDTAKKLTNEDTINGLCGAVAILFDLPSVTPQLSVPEVTALAEWTEKLTKASEDAYNKGYADGVKSVNICPHCGEYIGEEE